MSVTTQELIDAPVGSRLLEKVPDGPGKYDGSESLYEKNVDDCWTPLSSTAADYDFFKQEGLLYPVPSTDFEDNQSLDWLTLTLPTSDGTPVSG